MDKDKIDLEAGPSACPDFTQGKQRGLPLQKELPEGWVWKTLGEIIKLSTEKINPPNINEMPYVGLEHIEKHTGKLLDYGSSKNVRSTKTRFSKGDLLYGKLRPYLNKVYVADFDGICSTDILVFSKSSFASNKYLLYRFLSGDFVRFANRNVSGVQHPRVDFKKLSNFPISLPPLNDQKLIVSEIEKQFSRLDEAMAALKRVRAGLKRYKASVLKDAVEGKLTEEWRKNQIFDLTQDKKLKNNNLPIGWALEKVSDLGEVITGTTPPKAKKEYYDSKDYPFFKPADLNEGYYVKKSEDGLSKKGIEEARLLPVKSILVTCIGATIGKTGLIRVSGAFNQQINAIAPQKNAMPEFVYFVCISPQFQKSIIDNASATTLPILNKRKFEMLTMPIPPLIEQQKIVEEIESRLSVAEEIEGAIDINLKRAERLRQAILKKAFSGRLV